MAVPRIVIAGTHSGVGKTTLSSGLMALLAQRHPIQGYKVGPDYIDPSYHRLATGRPSRNLDSWLLGDELSRLFWQSAQGYWAVIEGVMGLFDGMRGTRGFGSTAEIAKQVQAPVLLVVDAASLAQSAAALVYGFQHYDPELQLSGVIFNRVRSSAQEQMLRDAIAPLDLPVLGCLPREDRFRLPERHLGLVPVDEQALRQGYLAELADFLKEHLDLSGIERIMSEAPVELGGLRETFLASGSQSRDFAGTRMVRLGIAQDEAFLFYYQDALDTLKYKGFELVPFSPLHDLTLPARLDALFIGGGFPELFLRELSENQEFLASLRVFAQAKKPIYAECGGFMYLGEQIKDFEGQTYSLAGLIPMSSQMTVSLQGIGYRKGLLAEDGFLGAQGSVVHGHEFHYSKAEFSRAHRPLFHLHKGAESLHSDGYAEDNIAASYLHLHFTGQPELVDHWLGFLQGE